MEFRVLGPLEIVEGSRQLHVSGARERALLAVLLIHVGEAVAAGRLIEELWGSEIPGNPANALQVVVSRVRKALEVPDSPGRLVTRKPGYLLDVRPDEVDAGRFERLLQEAIAAGSTDLPHVLSLLEEALGLWRGPAFAEFTADGFARDEITRLEEERFRAVEMKAEAELALGRHAGLVGELTALVGANPLRERLRGQLMLALYRSGRRGRCPARLSGGPRRPGGGAWRRPWPRAPGAAPADPAPGRLPHGRAGGRGPVQGQPAGRGDELRRTARRTRRGGEPAAPVAPGDADRSRRHWQDQAGH